MRKTAIRRFSGGQLTAIIIAVVIVVGFPVGASATLRFTNVSITDPHGTNRAFVNGAGQLETNVHGAVQASVPAHPFTLSGTFTSGFGTKLRCTTTTCHIAITDVVLTQDNTAHVPLGMGVSLNQLSGGNCTGYGSLIKDILPPGYRPAQQTTTVNFTTPVVTAVNPVCLWIVVGFAAGQQFGYTINGFWEAG